MVHPVAALRDIADMVDAKLPFDATHQCGMIAGGTFPKALAAKAADRRRSFDTPHYIHG